MITISIKKMSRVALIGAIILLAVGISPGSAEKLSVQALPAPAIDPDDMGAAFTYQGRLLSGSSPASGVYDFKFSLYDDAGSISETLLNYKEFDDITVTNGLFMVDVDFGARYFLGFSRWLEIGVRPGASSGSYTTLSPRQQINPTPYATFARTIYRKTLVIKPVIPDNPMANGQLLYDTINNIVDATPSAPYLVKLEPGTYNLGPLNLQMKPYVDLEGSGEGVTLITAWGMNNDSAGELYGSVNGADGVEIRNLSIESVGYDSNFETFYDNAIGVYVPAGTTLKLTHVTVTAYNADQQSVGVMNAGEYVEPPKEDPYFIPANLILDTVNVNGFFDDTLRNSGIDPRTCGISNSDTSTLTMTTSQVVAGGSLYATGIDDYRGIATIYDSKIVVKGGNINNYIGIYNRFAESSLYMRNSVVSASGDDGIGGSFVAGIMNNQTYSVQVFDSSVYAYGTGTAVYGINSTEEQDNPKTQLKLDNVKVEAYGDSRNIGIYNDDIPSTIINNSQVNAFYDMGWDTENIGLYFHDYHVPTDTEISQTVINAWGAKPDDGAIVWMNSNIGVKIDSDGRFKFYRDTIKVDTQTDEQGALHDGGLGIANRGGTITFENSTINTEGEVASVGIYHEYSLGGPGIPPWLPNLYVNNSEIYTCRMESYCVTVYAREITGQGVAPGIAFIGSTLLWGGSVVPAGGMPAIQCMWVHDEGYIGYGWPAMGPVPASFVCP